LDLKQGWILIRPSYFNSFTSQTFRALPHCDQYLVSSHNHYLDETQLPVTKKDDIFIRGLAKRESTTTASKFRFREVNQNIN
jgi:hypothetical protein